MALVIALSLTPDSRARSLWENSTPHFNLHELTGLGAQGSRADWVSNRGIVVGQGMLRSGLWHACSWTDGRAADLGTLGGPESEALGINDSNIIVGWSQKQRCGASHFACLWRRGRIEALPTLAGKSSEADAINDTGTIVGTAQNKSGVRHAVVWRSGRIVDLNRSVRNPRGWILTKAEGINRQGDIVGQMWHPTEFISLRGFLISHGRVTDLWSSPTARIHGVEGADGMTEAVAINDSGEIAGMQYGIDYWIGIFKGRTHLSTVPALGGRHSELDSINCCGVAVGNGDTVRVRAQSSRPHALLYWQSRAFDLNRLVVNRRGLILYDAGGVNDSLDIIAATIQGGQEHAYLLVPTRRKRGSA